jgi:hypothetical protein
MWLGLDSSGALHGFLDIDHNAYDGKIMKSCRLTSPPERRTFDRRLANMSIDIKERILTIGNKFVKEEFVDPYIVYEGTTLLKAKGHLGNTQSKAIKHMVGS